MAKTKITFGEGDTPTRVADLVANMRQEDMREILSSHGDDPTATVWQAIDKSSEWHSVYADGVLICLGGVQPLNILSNTGIPWLLTTEKMKEHPTRLLWWSRHFVERWQEDFPVLQNYVDARYAPALRWVKWLGFTIENTFPFGPEAVPFHKIVRRK